MRRCVMSLGVCCLVSVAGCHSRYVETTITNDSPARLNVLQVEYPSASFGVQTLEPGASFHYRFKLYGSGPLKLSYYDAHQAEHHQEGPVLSEGEEGSLLIRFPAQDHAEFQTRLHR